MIHLFKVSDSSWVFSGTTCPSNMEGDDYAQGTLPEDEIWDNEYDYTLVDGIATKGNVATIPDISVDTHTENRIQAYPSIEEQLDMQFHDSVNGTTTWKDTIQAIKDDNPKS
jgi:hypothetical protein|tara:strand:- start:83 stop:418 length:336 start_codon:yes stop_codon:yes gene_type:complete